MKKAIYFSVILISIIISGCFKFRNAEDKILVYYKPKLYPILDENYPPYRPDNNVVEDPEVRLLSETNKGIIFEFVDSTFPNPTEENKPYKDTFYCILTEDRILKYFNGYIDYMCYSVWDDEKVRELNLSEFITKEGSSLSVSSNVFQFRELYREYDVKLTDTQYKEIINKIALIDKKFEPTGEEEFAAIADRYIYKGLCFKLGYFDAKAESATPILKNTDELDRVNLKEKSAKEFSELYNEIYDYIQSLIPNLETYKFK